MRTSKKTSPMMIIRVSSAGFLFSRRLAARVLIMPPITSFLQSDSYRILYLFVQGKSSGSL